MGIAFGGECMNWMDMTLREYQAALASSSPTPGGGTAAAVALGQAASLAIMVCDLYAWKGAVEGGMGGRRSGPERRDSSPPRIGRTRQSRQRRL